MNNSIANNEGKWLMLSLFIPKLLFTSIYTLIMRCGTGAYIEVIYLSLIIFVLAGVLLKLYSVFGSNDIFSITHFAGGRFGEILFGALMIILSIANTSIMLRIFSSVISLLVLKSSSVFFVMLFIALTMYASAIKGIQAVSKVSVLWGGIIFTIFAIILIMSISKIDINNIFPVLGKGTEEIIGGYKDLPFFFEIIYFVFLIPYLGKGFKKVCYKSIITFSAVFFTLTLFYIFLVPYPASEDFKFPLLHIASLVNIDVLFQRIESLYLIALIFSAFMYLSTTFTISINIAEKTFCLSNSKAIAGALLIIIFSLALSIGTTQDAFIYHNLLENIFFVIGFSVITIILTIANIKKKLTKEEIKK